MTYPIAPGREPRRVPSSSTILLVLLSYYRRSRGELETPRLRVHGVALPTAELHPAPRAVIARREPTHRTELPRRRRRRRRRGGGEVGRDLGGDAIGAPRAPASPRRTRRLLRLRRAARRALPALTPALLLQDGAHACDERGEERTWGEVTIRSEGVERADGGSRRHRERSTRSRMGSRDPRACSGTYPRCLRSRTRLSSSPPASASALSFSSASRRAAATCRGMGGRVDA